jgi:hypothetical protein
MKRTVFVSIAVVTVAAAASAATFVPRGAARALSDCSRTSTGMTPLIDLGTRAYKGFQGGLYPNGSNVPPPDYASRGLDAASRIRPRDTNGAGSPTGRIVLLSIGMSNASLEFNGFRSLERQDAALAPQVVLVNGAEPGQDAEAIDTTSSPYWSFVDMQLARSGVTRLQVGAVWLKEAIADETEPFPADAQQLERDLDAIVSILTQRFPNLMIVYLASRTYGGYATIPLNPEPFAYESGFAVKLLVQNAIAAPRRPWLAWGPYLWTDGLRGRSDGLVWTCDDVGSDGTHPSPSGVDKVALLLHRFFTSDPTAAPWFTR